MKEILLCIPRVEGILKRDFIYRHIKKMEVGEIKSFVEKPLRNEDRYKRIIIRMSNYENNNNNINNDNNNNNNK